MMSREGGLFYLIILCALRSSSSLLACLEHRVDQGHGKCIEPIVVVVVVIIIVVTVSSQDLSLIGRQISSPFRQITTLHNVMGRIHYTIAALVDTHSHHHIITLTNT